MKKLLLSLLVVGLVSTIVLAPAAADEFKNSDFKGAYAVFTEGVATLNGNPGVVVGRLTADGEGNISGTRTVTTSFGTDPPHVAVTENFVCTYTVNSNGTGTVACTIFDFCKSTEHLALVMVSKSEIHLIITRVLPELCPPFEFFARVVLKKQKR